MHDDFDADGLRATGGSGSGRAISRRARHVVRGHRRDPRPPARGARRRASTACSAPSSPRSAQRSRRRSRRPSAATSITSTIEYRCRRPDGAEVLGAQRVEPVLRRGGPARVAPRRDPGHHPPHADQGGAAPPDGPARAALRGRRLRQRRRERRAGALRPRSSASAPSAAGRWGTCTCASAGDARGARAHRRLPRRRPGALRRAPRGRAAHPLRRGRRRARVGSSRAGGRRGRRASTIAAPRPPRPRRGRRGSAPCSTCRCWSAPRRPR